MASGFNIDDSVIVCMSRNNCFPFQNGTYITHIKVLHIPSDIGDCWVFERKDGLVFSVNPSSSSFVGLIKETEIDVIAG